MVVGCLFCSGGGSDLVFVVVGALELLAGCDLEAESDCVESGSLSSRCSSCTGSGSSGGGAASRSSASVSKPTVVSLESSLSSFLGVGALACGLGIGS